MEYNVLKTVIKSEYREKHVKYYEIKIYEKERKNVLD